MGGAGLIVQYEPSCYEQISLCSSFDLFFLKGLLCFQFTFPSRNINRMVHFLAVRSFTFFFKFGIVRRLQNQVSDLIDMCPVSPG